MKIRIVRAELFQCGRMDGRTDRQTDGQADRHDETDSRFSQFCDSA
jgi:hypothetical protein